MPEAPAAVRPHDDQVGSLSAGDAVESVNSTSLQSSPVSWWMRALYSTRTCFRSAAERIVYVGDHPQLLTR